jgi:hypothetical protein
MSTVVEDLRRGVVGTKDTLERMHKLVALGKLDPTMQKIATWIRLQVPGDRRGSTKATADAVFYWVQKHGIFQRDPFQIEKIEHPIESMRPVIEARKAGTYKGPGLFVGDCDTIAGVYTATLLGILGFQYAFETAKVDPDRPDEFSHVWDAALIGGEWYPLDPSTKGAYPGWRPPVSGSKFARWPEKPIETVVKASDLSGMGDSNPLAGVDAQYAKDYIGYGVPKDFGAGPGVIPPGNFEDLQLLAPHDTQIPDADMDPDMHLLKAAPRLDPAERIQNIDGHPNDHGNPYYRAEGAQPYFKVNDSPYPPGSRWNGKVGIDQTRYVKPGNYVKVKSAESPERQVEVQMGQPMLLRRRTVMTTPRRVPYGAMEGMGDEDMPDPSSGDEPSGFVTSLPSSSSSSSDDWKSSLVTSVDAPKPTVTPTPAAKATPTTQAAAAAGGSVWDAISSVFKSVGSVVPASLQAKAAQAVSKATNGLVGSNVLGVTQTAPTPWYFNPFVLGGGALTLGGIAYVVMKSRPGSGRRRRR